MCFSMNGAVKTGHSELAAFPCYASCIYGIARPQQQQRRWSAPGTCRFQYNRPAFSLVFAQNTT